MSKIITKGKYSNLKKSTRGFKSGVFQKRIVHDAFDINL